MAMEKSQVHAKEGKKLLCPLSKKRKPSNMCFMCKKPMCIEYTMEFSGA